MTGGGGVNKIWRGGGGITKKYGWGGHEKNKMCGGGVRGKNKMYGGGVREKIKMCGGASGIFSSPSPPPEDFKWNSPDIQDSTITQNETPRFYK